MAEKLLAFYIFALSAAITPGPTNVLVMSVGAARGWRGALPCLAGVVLGMGALIAATSAGLAGLLRLVPQLTMLLGWAGALLLLYMAWKVARSPGRPGEAGARDLGFWPAFGFQWINPKSWVVGVSAAAAFGDLVARHPVIGPAVLGMTFAAAVAPSSLVWLLFGTALRGWLSSPRRARWFARTMGAALALSVLLIVRP